MYNACVIRLIEFKIILAANTFDTVNKHTPFGNHRQTVSYRTTSASIQTTPSPAHRRGSGEEGRIQAMRKPHPPQWATDGWPTKGRSHLRQA